MSDRDERIRQRAYEIWEREGRPEGLQQRHWDQAAEEIAAEEAQQGNGGISESPGTEKSSAQQTPGTGRKPRNKKL